MPKTLLACKNCRALTYQKQCPVCKSTNLTPNWKGYLYVIDPEKSEVAKKIGVTLRGRFALMVS